MPVTTGSIDWTTVASLATAAGTLVLALATFSSVRSANRAARVAELSLQTGLRPLLLPGRVQDPPQKVMWGDQHWASVGEGRAVVELLDDVIYLAIQLRNAGSGIAVLQAWYASPEQSTADMPRADLDDFRRLGLDIYIAGGDIGTWLSAFRDRSEPVHAQMRTRIEQRQSFVVDLLYGDSEGGQRTVSRFSMVPAGDDAWVANVVRHWNLDRQDPR